MFANRLVPSFLSIALLSSLALACQRTPRESLEVGEVATAGEKAEREQLELRAKEEAYAEVKRTHLKSRSQATLAAADQRTRSLEARKQALAGRGLVEVKKALETVSTARVALTEEMAKLDDASPSELTALSTTVEKAESELVTAVKEYEAVVAKG